MASPRRRGSGGGSGPALAASGRRVVAVDLPGHGQTGHWAGHHRFRDTAADVAAWIRATALDVPELQIVGHSWGAMVTAALPVAGIRPATLVLLEPPTIPHAYMAQQASDTSGMICSRTSRRPSARSAGCTRTGPRRTSAPMRRRSARSTSRLPARSCSRTATGMAAWPTCPIRPRTASPPGSSEATRRPAEWCRTRYSPRYAARIGADHIVTLPGAGHSPQRLQPAELTAALLGALG